MGVCQVSYISTAYHIPKKGGGTRQKSCKNVYVINGRPLKHCEFPGYLMFSHLFVLKYSTKVDNSSFDIRKIKKVQSCWYSFATIYSLIILSLTTNRLHIFRHHLNLNQNHDTLNCPLILWPLPSDHFTFASLRPLPSELFIFKLSPDCLPFAFKVFGDEADLYKLEDVQIQDLGQVGEVTVTKDDTLFMKVSTF